MASIIVTCIVYENTDSLYSDVVIFVAKCTYSTYSAVMFKCSFVGSHCALSSGLEDIYKLE